MFNKKLVVVPSITTFHHLTNNINYYIKKIGLLKSSNEQNYQISIKLEIYVKSNLGFTS